jgi:hypothetical protein
VRLLMKKLGEDPDLQLQNIRFFGKFFGIYHDYYVVEAVPSNPPQAHVETVEGMLNFPGPETLGISVVISPFAFRSPS